MRVGIIGLITDETSSKVTEIANRVFEFYSSLEGGKKGLEEIFAEEGEQKPDVLILLTHIASYQEISSANKTIISGKDGELEKLAKLPNIDLILTAHSHKKVQGTLNNVHILQTGAYGKYFGIVYISTGKNISTGSNSRILHIETELRKVLLASHIEPIHFMQDHPAFKELQESIQNISKCQNDHQTYANNKILWSPANFTTNNRESVSWCSLGGLVAEAISNTLNYPIGIINNGQFRANITYGNITVKEIHRVFKHANKIYGLNITGRGLKSAIESNFRSKAFTEPRKLCSWYGLWIKYDLREGNGNGNGNTDIIKEMRLSEGEIIQDEKYYLVAITNFLVQRTEGVFPDGFNFQEGDVVQKSDVILADSLVRMFLEGRLRIGKKKAIIMSLSHFPALI